MVELEFRWGRCGRWGRLGRWGGNKIGVDKDCFVDIFSDGYNGIKL